MIDINCDMGERDDVPEEAIMPLITSANVACGGHAGGGRAMERTLALAIEHHVRCGAHPGYPDRANFGRLALPMSAAEIAQTVYEQVAELDAAACILNCSLTHVKPHGALYNTAAVDGEVAAAIAEGVRRWNPGVPLVGLAGSRMLEVWRRAGFEVIAEGFADRAYEPDGTLRPRHLPGAVISDPNAAAEQAAALAAGGRVETICVHSDSPRAVEILRAIRARLAR